MSIELISDDPLTGLKTYLEFDEVDPRKFHIHHRQDVSQSIEYVKRLQNSSEYKKEGIRRGMYHVAHVTAIAQIKLLREHGIDVMNKDHWPKFRRLLNDPEWKYLRPAEHRV